MNARGVGIWRSVIILKPSPLWPQLNNRLFLSSKGLFGAHSRSGRLKKKKENSIAPYQESNYDSWAVQPVI